jgi:restriction endonuclease Mrr
VWIRLTDAAARLGLSSNSFVGLAEREGIAITHRYGRRGVAAAGVERAVLVTIGRFSEPARRAATTATPTVDLIDGEKLCELVREKEVGLRTVPQVQESWFDRFDR